MNADPKIDVLTAIESNPSAIFSDKSLSVADLVAKLKQRHDGEKVDLSTDKGRKAVASRARSVVAVKTSIDNAGKELNSGLRDKINAVDEIRREVRSELDALRDTIRKPLTDWEQQEESRIADHKALIERIVEASYVSQADTSDAISQRIDWLHGLDLSETALQEFSVHAQGKRDFALNQLRPAWERAKETEEARAELERLRKLQAEQEEREAKAQKELDAARQAEAEKHAAAEAEERRKREAAEQAAAAAEAAREEAEAKAEQERKDLIAAQERKELERLEGIRKQEKEERSRAENKRHRNKIHRSAVQAIQDAGDLGEPQAQKIVAAIAAGAIPNVSISY